MKEAEVMPLVLCGGGSWGLDVVCFTLPDSKPCELRSWLVNSFRPEDSKRSTLDFLAWWCASRAGSDEPRGCGSDGWHGEAETQGHGAVAHLCIIARRFGDALVVLCTSMTDGLVVPLSNIVWAWDVCARELGEGGRVVSPGGASEGILAAQLVR